MPDGLLKTVVYTGVSMNPTLKAADLLQVLPYRAKNIQRGDVIVFNHSGAECTVTHRVACVDSHAIRTRGDNSSSVDPWILSPDNIIGRVVYLKRGNRRLRIYGGRMGRLFAAAVRAIHIMDSRISTLLRPAYYWMARAGVFRRWVPARLKIRVVSFKQPGGMELRLLIGRRVIGRFLPGRNQWLVQRPFRLFVNEASLPQSDRSTSASSELRAL